MALDPESGANGYSATTVEADRVAVPWATTYDLWLVDARMSFLIAGGTALSASHKWVTTFLKSAPGVQSTIATATIDSGNVWEWRSTSVVAIGALLGTTNVVFAATHTKTGRRGTSTPSPRFRTGWWADPRGHPGC